VVRVIVDDGQSRTVDMSAVQDVKSFYARIFAKFNIYRERDNQSHVLLEKEMEKWVFLLSDKGIESKLFRLLIIFTFS
jgi:hypothetical protein